MDLESSFSKSAELHDLAADLDDKAYFARRVGNNSAEIEYTKLAYLKEAEAAKLLRQDPSHHMHVALHLNAALFAYRSGYYQESENLIAHGLTGHAGDIQRAELYDLLAKVRLCLSMESHDPPNTDNELELTLQGLEADAGLLDVDTLSSQMKDWHTLLRSTIRYVLSYQFKEQPASENKFRVLATPPTRGSFKINIRLLPVGKQLSLPNFDATAINARILSSFNTLQSGRLGTLRSSYESEEYYHDFMKLAKSVAPDGEKVTAIGIEAAIDNRRRSVLFDRTADDISSVYVPPVEQESFKEYRFSDELHEVTGELRYADAMTPGQEEFKLRAEDDSEWRIHVPNEYDQNLGVFYKSRVKVSGRYKYLDRRSNLLQLESIELARK
ncbi:MAG: hypothetical protein OXI77_05965 [Chloroflexota bacterium]|nr:hypothetical protein [Chloroflexota bacterium]MDE2910042.1 hypothetical protein [Chloroflexota bacterium]